MATTYAYDLLNPEQNEVKDSGVLSFTGAAAVIPATLNQVSPKGTVTSGALATQQLVTATGAQVSTARDVETHTPCTLTNAAGTVTVALSPDNVTYSTLAVVTPAVHAPVTGGGVRVPARGELKVTVSPADPG